MGSLGAAMGTSLDRHRSMTLSLWEVMELVPCWQKALARTLLYAAGTSARRLRLHEKEHINGSEAAAGI
jgi:hypothetical protein